MKILQTLFLTVLALAQIPLVAAPIKLVGSDVVGEKIVDELKKNAESIGIEFVAEMEGSRDGLLNLKQKKADIAIVAVVDKDGLPADKVAIPYAHQIAVVIVNAQNPIDEITIPQLAQIYADLGEKIDKWQSFGLSGNVSLRNISPMAVESKENITLELFKHVVLSGNNPSTNVDTRFGSKDIIRTVSNTVNSIAVVSIPPNMKEIRELGVANSANGQFFKPTPENIHNGDYPISLHFYLVYDPADTQRLKPVLQMLLSDTIANRLEEGLLIPAPKNFRKSYILSIDTAK